MPPPNEPRCKTTTTVECTGTAAPYAVPYADPAPAPVYQPSQPPPPAYAPPPVYAPPPPQYAQPPQYPPYMPQLRLGDGFRTVIDPNGQLMVERRTRLGRPGVWGLGLAMFVGMPLLTGIGLGLDRTEGNKTLYGGLSMLPVFGAFTNAGIAADDCSWSYDYCDKSKANGRAAGWAIAGLIQASGLVMLLVGLGTGPEKIERFPLRFSAGPTQNGGMSFGMNGQF